MKRMEMDYDLEKLKIGHPSFSNLILFLYENRIYNNFFWHLTASISVTQEHLEFSIPCFAAKDVRVTLNLRLVLVSTASWVSVAEHFVLMNTGRFHTGHIHCIV